MKLKIRLIDLQQLYVVKMILHQRNFVYDTSVQDDIWLDFQDEFERSKQMEKHQCWIKYMDIYIYIQIRSNFVLLAKVDITHFHKYKDTQETLRSFFPFHYITTFFLPV
jgi:hypothetical protein